MSKKEIRVKTSIVAGLAALLMVLPSWRTGTLPEISKPYLGVYECKSATLGSQELLKDFSLITLELQKDGKYLLSYTEKGNKKHEVTGEYMYDSEKNTLTFYADGKAFKREFPLEKGVLTVFFRLGDKNVKLQFEQK